MKETMEKSFDVLLFDLGGVLVKLTGAPRMMALTRGRLSLDALWTRWLDSPGVKKFESGKSTSKEFAMAMVDEFGLLIDPTRFIEEFSEWSTTLYPGARRLLAALADSYILVSLSNTNHIHWTYFREALKLPDFFHHNFPSHETGYLKPDPEAYLNVVRKLSVTPGRVLFIDDLEQNVVSARGVGLKAFRAKGIDEVVHRLLELGLVATAPFPMHPDQEAGGPEREFSPKNKRP